MRIQYLRACPAVDFVQQLVQYDGAQRMTARAALAHPFLASQKQGHSRYAFLLCASTRWPASAQLTPVPRIHREDGPPGPDGGH